MKFFYKTFLKGLFAVLPVTITAYLLVWLFSTLESIFKHLLIWLLPSDWYLPGMGLVIGLAGIFLIGLLLQAWIARRLWHRAEKIVDKMPLVRDIYSSIKQVFAYISGSARPAGQQAVMIRIGEPPVRLLGLITVEDFEHKPEGIEEELLAVFLPWSYQVGGFTVYVPRSAIESVDLSPEQALKLALTAGVSRTKPEKPQASDPPRTAVGQNDNLGEP